MIDSPKIPDRQERNRTLTTTSLPGSVGARGTRILGVGSCTPSRVVDNAEMCTYIDSSDEWIQQRTGIAERRWLGAGETLESISMVACQRAIAKAGIQASDIDTVMVATISSYASTPAFAPTLAFKLGALGAAAHDISAACAGFCYGLAHADALIRTGASRYVLVVGVDTLSRMTNLADRSTAFLWADGAGAAVVGPSEVNGIGPVVWGSDGAQADAITQVPDWENAVATGIWPSLAMEGKLVFRWATEAIATAAQKCLEASRISPDDLDVFIPHQANDRITNSMVRHLKLPDRVVVARTIRTLGNSSAATVPMALDALLESGEAQSGQTALIIGFGAGLAYAGQVVILP